MPQPRLKSGWFVLMADNGDLILTAMVGGEHRLPSPPPPIRELLRRLAAGESLAGFGPMLGVPADDADRQVGEWVNQLAELGVIDRDGDVPPADWRRYDAQMAVFAAAASGDDTGLKAQRRLAAKTVALLGAGPVNQHLARHLALAGVGRLRLVDDGVVTVADAESGTLWTAAEVGLPRTEAFAAAIARLNPHVAAEFFIAPWRDGLEATGGVPGADLALIDLGGRGLWDRSGVDRGAHQACFRAQVPVYHVQATNYRLTWGPIMAPGVGPCYVCLANKLIVAETQRLVDRQRWLNPPGSEVALFPPFAAEVASLAVPEILLFLTELLDAEQLQRLSFMHVPGRSLQTSTIGPEAMCEWCGVGTPAFRHRSAAYARLDVRPMSFAGKSYPSDGDEATAAVGAYFRHAPRPAKAMPRGIIAPHIEPRIGAISYGQAYGAFPDGHFPRRVIILATSHYPQSRVVGLSPKPFLTPWGQVDVDRPAVERLARAVGGDPYADEALFGYEHAIEFPAIFLEMARRRAGAPPVQLVPVLCGSLHEPLTRQRHPNQVGEVAEFVGTLRELIAEDPEGTCVVSSVDMSHVGPRYGDPRGLNGEELARVAAWDRQLLDHLVAGDANGYWEQVATIANGTRVCGLTPLYLQSAALPECRGELLHYDLCLFDPATTSHVGHAAALLLPQD
jgi:AmmeMemoRadiSam system protein B